MIQALTQSRLRAIVWLALIALLLYFASMLVRYPPAFVGVDLAVWQGDWKKMLCLLGGTDCGGLNKFPFAYLAMSGLLEAISPLTAAVLSGLTEIRHPLADAALGMSVMNALFLLIPVGYFWWTDRADWCWRSLVYTMVISATALLPFYVVSGGLELQAGVLLGICVASAMRVFCAGDQRRRLLAILFASVLLAPLYKDAHLPIIGITFLLTLLAGWRSSRTALSVYLSTVRLPLAVAALAGLLSLSIILAYNYFRYSSVLPLGYINEAEYSRQSMSMVFSNLLAVLFSPNGGALVFWSFSLSILACCAWLLRVRFSTPVIKLCAVIFGLSVLISANWWSPFGWDGWGNRLLVPGMLAVIILLVSTLERRALVVERATVTTRASTAKAVTGFGLFIVCVLSAVYVFVSYSGNRDAYLHDSLWGADSCEQMYTKVTSMDVLSFMTARLYQECYADRFLRVPALFALSTQVGLPAPLEAPPVILPGSTFAVPKDLPRNLLRDGWSDIENWGVWSSGHNARLAFVPAAPLQELVLSLAPLTAATLPAQRVRVLLNGGLVQSVELDRPALLTIKIADGDQYNGEKLLELELELPDAAQPSRLGINPDERTLGVGLTALEVR